MPFIALRSFFFAHISEIQEHALAQGLGPFSIPDLLLASQVSRSEGTDGGMVRSGSRIVKVVKDRRLFCQLAVKKFGYLGAEVARHLGTATSSITRMENSP